MEKINSAWSETQQWLHEATNTVEVLPGDSKQGAAIFQQLQVSPRSLLGTLALETGGIFVDHGWVRFLGSGSERMHGNLVTWNSAKAGYGLRDAFIVAHDVLGGFFAMNGGAFPGERGNIYYLAPETLKWQDLHGSYSQLFSWALTGNVEQFYQPLRWLDWKDEVTTMSGDQGFSIIPFLWTGAEPPISERSRRIIPMTELWGVQQEFARQIGDAKPGTPIRIHLI